MTSAYYLGCPVWACERWKGRLFSRNAARSQWLRQYSTVFNCVEGNSTFYALPSDDTVQRWAEAAKPGFRFALKFPQVISHEKRLIDCERETADFLHLLELLKNADRLGPAFLQLPSGFSARHLAELSSYLEKLPSDFRYAVELRNREFFDAGRTEQAVNEVLARSDIDRVILDSRALFSAPPSDRTEDASQSRKPRLPVHPVLTGKHPIVRFVGRNDIRQATPWIREWVRTIAKWVNNGLSPFVFCHAPDEFHAPDFARAFHNELMQHTNRVSPLQGFAGECETHEKQLELF